MGGDYCCVVDDGRRLLLCGGWWEAITVVWWMMGGDYCCVVDDGRRLLFGKGSLVHTGFGLHISLSLNIYIYIFSQCVIMQILGFVILFTLLCLICYFLLFLFIYSFILLLIRFLFQLERVFLLSEVSSGSQESSNYTSRFQQCCSQFQFFLQPPFLRVYFPGRKLLVSLTFMFLVFFSSLVRSRYYYYHYYFTSCEFFTPVLAGGIALKSKWQPLFSGLQNSCKYS